jgi:superkiller protein 3
MPTNTRKIAYRSAGLLAAALAAAAMTAGCGQSKRSEARAQSVKDAHNTMKSATKWDMAGQRFRAGELDKALDLVDESIAFNENVAKSHILRGRILMEQAAFDEAFVSFDRAKEIEPTNHEAYYFAGLCYERITRKEDALTNYVKANELDPSSAQYVVAAAEMMIDLGRVNEAIAFIERQGEKFDHNAGVRQTLGHISMLRGEFEQAVEYFNEARVLAPEDTQVLEDLTRAQIATGRFAEAEYNLSQLQNVSGNQDRRDLKHMRSRCLIELDRLVEARQILINLTESEGGSRDAQAWIQLGHVAYMLKDGHRVKQSAARAIAIAPTKPEGYMLRALWQRQEGELNEAFKTLEQAVSFAGSDNPSPLIMHGVVAQQLGKNNVAKRSFARAQEIDPSNRAIAQLLRKVESEPTFATVPEDAGQQP